MTEEKLKWEELKEMDIRMNTLCYKWQRQEEHIAELEKGNAELKETVTKMNNVITKTFSNLTKAKELLKILLHKLIMAKAPYKTDLTKEEIAGLRNLIGEREEDLKLEDK